MSDIRLIDPTEKELAAALRKAMSVANRGLAGLKMEREAGFWTRFARDCLRTREGRRRSCRGGRVIPEVIAGWWTDPAGRRHVRVVGRARRSYGPLRREQELRGLPPWWHVYPESVLGVRGKDGAETFLAVCRCGAVGSPAALGWMGDSCGPCFDLRTEGGAPAQAFGHFGGWAASSGRNGFAGNGRYLVGQGVTGHLRLVDRHDRRELVARRLTVGLAALGDAADGAIVACGYDGTVFRWLPPEGPVEKLVRSSRYYGRVALAPDGSRAVVLAHGAGYTADLTAGAPRYVRRENPRTYAGVKFTPDGKRLIAVDWPGHLVSLDPDTLAATVLREPESEGRGYGHYAELAVAPDGEAVAVRRETYYPHAHTIRVLPLGPGPAAELRVPDWFTPQAVAFSPDGRYLLAADSGTGWVGFWERPGLKNGVFARAVPEEPGARGAQIEFAPDGESAAITYAGGYWQTGATVVVWPWREVARAAGSG